VNKYTKKGIIGLGVALAVLYGGRYVYVAATTKTVTDTFVRDSERVCSANDAQQCKYIAYGTNTIYENTDEWVFLKFNSSDVNKVLVRGATCELKVYGWRIPFLSWYPNIIEAKCH